jgi:DNA-nicking Smr family endonuclease
VRPLSAEEQQLWSRVTATITPLSREPVTPPPAQQKVAIAVDGPPPQNPARIKGRVPPPRTPVVATPARRTIAGNLDGHWDRRLRAGTVTPDRILDLHGHSLDRAWEAIDRTLERAIASGDRLVLLITGHHRPGEAPVQRGKIRAAVHDWLAVSRHAPQIAAVRSAHRRHGGGGSLYLVLRR